MLYDGDRVSELDTKRFVLRRQVGGNLSDSARPFPLDLRDLRFGFRNLPVDVGDLSGNLFTSLLESGLGFLECGGGGFDPIHEVECFVLHTAHARPLQLDLRPQILHLLEADNPDVKALLVRADVHVEFVHRQVALPAVMAKGGQRIALLPDRALLQLDPALELVAMRTKVADVHREIGELCINLLQGEKLLDFVEHDPPVVWMLVDYK